MLYNYDNQNTTYCKCQCECGNTIITKRQSLLTGNTKSCGCSHSPSLINQRFGRLVVLNEVINNTSQRKWQCKCDCGAQVILTSHQLTSGHTKSCGCLRSEKNSFCEMLIAQILSDHNIDYEKEKTFDECKGVKNKKLRFDYYLPRYHTCIEYDGEQHYKPIAFFRRTSAFQHSAAERSY